MDNVLFAGKGVRFYINFEECVNKVFGMQPLQHPVGIKSIDVEAPQHLPASEVIDDFKQRLFLVTFHESLKKTGSFFKQHTTQKVHTARSVDYVRQSCCQTYFKGNFCKLLKRRLFITKQKQRLSNSKDLMRQAKKNQL